MHAQSDQTVTDPACRAAYDCDNPVGPEKQCGGEDYEGSTCCEDGFVCMEMGVDYYEVKMNTSQMFFFCLCLLFSTTYNKNIYF